MRMYKLTKTFGDYLYGRFESSYHLRDADHDADRFPEWVGELELDTLCSFAESYAREQVDVALTVDLIAEAKQITSERD